MEHPSILTGHLHEDDSRQPPTPQRLPPRLAHLLRSSSHRFPDMPLTRRRTTERRRRSSGNTDDTVAPVFLQRGLESLDILGITGRDLNTLHEWWREDGGQFLGGTDEGDDGVSAGEEGGDEAGSEGAGGAHYENAHI